jgi:hypothetical protein
MYKLPSSSTFDSSLIFSVTHHRHHFFSGEVGRRRRRSGGVEVRAPMVMATGQVGEESGRCGHGRISLELCSPPGRCAVERGREVSARP